MQKITIKNGCNTAGDIKIKRYVHKSTDNNGIDSFQGYTYRKVGLELNDVKYPVKEIK
jgi:hypothetical protein